MTDIAWTGGQKLKDTEGLAESLSSKAKEKSRVRV